MLTCIQAKNALVIILKERYVFELQFDRLINGCCFDDNRSSSKRLLRYNLSLGSD